MESGAPAITVSPPGHARRHALQKELTTDLMIDAFPDVHTGENPAIEQQPHHDLFAIAPEQTDDLRPWSLLECGHIAVRIVCHDTGNAAGQRALFLAGSGVPTRRPLVPLGQEVLGLVAGVSDAIEQGQDDKVDDLYEWLVGYGCRADDSTL